MTLLAILWALIVLSWALFRLPRIIEALRHFDQLRTPIWDLRTAVQSLSDADWKGQLADLMQSIEAAQKQLAEMQRHAADERPAPTANRQAQETSLTEDKWEDIRRIWTEAREALEKIIDNISDGRTRRRYNGITRYSYAEIAKTLRHDGLISEEAAEAVQRMNETFLIYRRRSRPVTQEILQQFKNWKEDLDRHIDDTPSDGVGSTTSP